MILTSGTTGTPKGASRSQPETLDPAAALLSQDPAAGARDDDDRRAAVPLVGVRALHARDWRCPRRSCCGASSTPRRRCRAIAQHRAQRARRGAGDAPAHPRPRRRGDARVRHVVAARRSRVSGSALPGELATRVHGRVRRRPLQPLRLDRGGVGDDRHARRTCAPRPGTAGRPPRGTIAQDPRRRRAARCPPGETGRIFVGNEMLFEGYTGGGDEGGRRRPDGHRRRRPPRRGGPPVRRRPRRRHDRLRRRERVPARGRGPARQARRGRRGRRHRRRRRGVRPAPEGVRRDARAAPS